MYFDFLGTFHSSRGWQQSTRKILSTEETFTEQVNASQIEKKNKVLLIVRLSSKITKAPTEDKKNQSQRELEKVHSKEILQTQVKR